MSNSSILFFSEGIKFILREKKRLRIWLNASIANEEKSYGSINFIFCSDDFLHQMNKEHLDHDTLTDIITFDFSETPHNISGDIYISIDRVKENAKQFNVSFVDELHRVMIHGILHLSGYKDKTKKQSLTMRAKEDYYLSLLPEIS